MARSQKFTVFLSSFIASGIFLFAGNPARTGSPQEDALASLIEAERAFARAVEEKGVREAFLTYLAEGAIVFRPAPVEGRPLYEKMSPDNPALLTWTPEVAEVSASGDLGYTSGPFEVRPDREADEPSGYGHYVSVWRRQPRGEWKVVLDIGIPHDRPRSAPDDEVLRVLPLSTLPPGAGGRENPQALQELVDADLGLAAKAGLWGYLVALIDAGTEDVRVYRAERFPAEGRGRMSDILDLGIGKTTAEVKGGGAASSEDLGYTYGTFVFSDISGQTASSSYLKIWRKVPSAGWRICLDVALPVNPS